MSARRPDLLAAGAVALCLSAACGKQGPPLAPLRPIPAPVADLSASRIVDRITLRLTIPATNRDGSTPPAVERVEIYRLEAAAAATAPTVALILEVKNLLTTIDVRPPKPAAPAAGTPDARPSPGDKVSFVDAIGTNPRGAADSPVRHYVAVAFAGRRRSPPSPTVSVPLSRNPGAPTELAYTYDEKTLKITWKPAAAGQTFRLYELPGTAAVEAATLLTEAPLAAAEFSVPVDVGRPRCFSIRPVETTERVSIEGPAPEPVCVNPVDRFAPPRPEGLVAIAGDGAVDLVWTPVAAPDLAGYAVLRGEGTSGTLQRLMRDPIADTKYSDRDVRPGVTYVYSIIAIDKTGNVSEQSERQLATARALVIGDW